MRTLWWLRSPQAGDGSRGFYIGPYGTFPNELSRALCSSALSVAFGFSNGYSLSGTASNWWLRSPQIGSKEYYYGVNTSGSDNLGNNARASYANGVAFGYTSMAWLYSAPRLSGGCDLQNSTESVIRG